MTMSEETTGQPDNDAVIIEDDPALGKYVAHYPSNRLLLLLRGGVIYAAAVLVLQILFIGVDDTSASIVLIGAYSLLALGIAWYILHLWNREVILYERGFTYREGSRLGYFYYHAIRSVRQKAGRILFLNLIRRDFYHCTLISDQDEHLYINNLYSGVAELVTRLEAAITRARLPIVETRLARGETIDFGPRLALNQTGIMLDGQNLPWTDFARHRIEGKHLVLTAKSGAAFTMAVAELDNALLLLTLLKQRV